mgnify:CR=1 FL=1
MNYTDKSYPPVSDKLTYERGDGAVVDLKITPPIKLTSSIQSVTPPSQPPAVPPSVSQPVVSVIPADQAVNVQNLKAASTFMIPKGVPIKINPKARVNLRTGNEAQKPKTAQAPGSPTEFTDDRILDHPSVGGKFTIFVLFYGDYHDLHKKCLSNLLATVPFKRMDLRVGSNAVCQQTLDMIQGYVEQGIITKHYRHETNDYKYPVMREMFHDPDCPITTKWLLWFDDDSICDANSNWLNIMSIHIAQHHKGNAAHMVGASFIWSTNKRQREIMESRPWYHGRPWRNQHSDSSPNGTKIIFAAGGFWALTTEAMIAADIPDLGTGLTHTGGDWQIGEQLYQAGYGLKQFNGNKQFVRTSSVPRRGETKPTIDQVTNVPLLPVQQAERPPTNPPVFEQPPAPVTVPRLRKIVDL